MYLSTKSNTWQKQNRQENQESLLLVKGKQELLKKLTTNILQDQKLTRVKEDNLQNTN